MQKFMSIVTNLSFVHAIVSRLHGLLVLECHNVVICSKLLLQWSHQTASLGHWKVEKWLTFHLHFEKLYMKYKPHLKQEVVAPSFT